MHLKSGSGIDIAALESCVVALKASTHPKTAARFAVAHGAPSNIHVKTHLTSHSLHASFKDARFSTPDAKAQVSATEEESNEQVRAFL
jgi:hypothetical protein